MLSPANLILLECRILNLYNFVTFKEDVKYGIGLPLIVYDRINVLNFAKIDAAFIWHTNYTNSALKINLHRSLDGWSEDSKIILFSDHMPHLRFLQYVSQAKVNYVIIVTTEGKIFHYNQFKNRIEENCNLYEIIEDFNGFPIKMSAFRDPIAFPESVEDPGIDGAFIVELGKKLNFTMKIIKSKDFNNAADQLMQGMSEMIINAYFTCTFNENLKTITFPLYADKQSIAVRQGEILRGWYVFASTMSWKAMLAILGGALFANSVAAITSKNYDWTTFWPMTLRAMFMIPMTKTLKGTTERLIIGGCLLFGSVLVPTYQATLYHFIKTEMHHKIPETITDLRLYHTHYRHVTEDRVFLDYQLARIDSNAFLIRYKLYGLMSYTRMIANFQLIPESLCTGTMGYALKKDDVLLETFNRYILWSAQAGLADIWYRKTVYNKPRRTPIKNDQHLNSGAVIAIETQDLEVAFFVIFVGQFFGTVLFLFEIMASFISRRWIRPKLKYNKRHVFVN